MWWHCPRNEQSTVAFVFSLYLAAPIGSSLVNCKSRCPWTLVGVPGGPKYLASGEGTLCADLWHFCYLVSWPAQLCSQLRYFTLYALRASGHHYSHYRSMRQPQMFILGCRYCNNSSNYVYYASVLIIGWKPSICTVITVAVASTFWNAWQGLA